MCIGATPPRHIPFTFCELTATIRVLNVRREWRIRGRRVVSQHQHVHRCWGLAFSSQRSPVRARCCVVDHHQARTALIPVARYLWVGGVAVASWGRRGCPRPAGPPPPFAARPGARSCGHHARLTSGVGRTLGRRQSLSVVLRPLCSPGRRCRRLLFGCGLAVPVVRPRHATCRSGPHPHTHRPTGAVGARNQPGRHTPRLAVALPVGVLVGGRRAAPCALGLRPNVVARSGPPNGPAVDVRCGTARRSAPIGRRHGRGRAKAPVLAQVPHRPRHYAVLRRAALGPG